MASDDNGGGAWIAVEMAADTEAVERDC